jgi:hypothetical protein
VIYLSQDFWQMQLHFDVQTWTVIFDRHLMTDEIIEKEKKKKRELIEIN